MKWWRQYQAWRRERERQLVAQSIRDSMACFGYDMSDMTVEEIEEGCQRMAKICGQVGASAEDVNNAAQLIGMLYVLPSTAKDVIDTPERALQAGRVLGVVNHVSEKIRDA